METAPWQIADKPRAILVGGREFEVVKSGAAYAEQLRAFLSWVSRLGSQVSERLRAMGYSPESTNGLDLAVALLSIGLEPEHLFELGAIILGIDDPDFVRDNFDVGWMLDAMIRIWEQQPGLRWTVQTVQRRFFSNIGAMSSSTTPST